ncbi:PAS domain S-box protein, partial [bacterium]|nr:PAS domain S-box protein [bacterium]
MIIDVNPFMIDKLGFPHNEFIGKNIWELGFFRDIGINKAKFHELQEKGYVRYEDLPLKTANGREMSVEFVSNVYLVGQKKVIQCNIRDITERKQAEEERIRLETVIEQASECVVITDVKGTIQYVNPAFEKITGYSIEEAIGQNPRMLKSGKHEEIFYKNMWDTLLSGNKWNGRFINKKKDGQLYTEEASISPIIDKTGAITNFAAVKRDVTNELLTEQRQRETQKMEAIGTLAGGIAHDFNNILSAIIGYTELSMDEVPEGSQLHSDLTKIFKAGYRARDLVNQILTFSRQREQEKRPILIDPIIKETLKMLRASLPSTIEIRQSIEPEPGTVRADATQIHQVIMNLCTNAGQAMSQKGGILEVILTSKELDSGFCIQHPGLVPGRYLKLMVSDTGHGIPQDILPRIFEPYFTTRDKSGGTGLGLAMVHGIVTDCGGAVTVYSEPGKGTTFKVYLPVIMEEPADEAEKTAIVIKGHEHILFIDDEKDIGDVGKRILEQLGYTVTVMTSSIDALEFFQKDPYRFDLVITDMTMPFMTGDELSEEFMRIRQDIPIIVCTGYSEKLTEETALSIGIRAYMGKPLLKSEMAETVRRVLDERNEGI